MADPLSVAGTTIGGISLLFQIYSGVVQGVQLMLDVNDVPDKYRTMYFRLELEHGKLLSWGHIFGFVESNDDPQHHQQPLVRISIPDEVRYMVQGHLEPLWNRILKFTADIPHFEEPPGSGSDRVPSYGSGHRFILSRKYRDLKLMGLKLKDRIKWAHFKMDKLEDLVGCVRHVNNSVIALSELKTQQEIHEMVQSTWMGLLDVQKTVGGLRELIEALSVNSAPGHDQTEDLLRDLAHIKQLRVQSDVDVNTPIPAGDLGDDSSLKLVADRVCPQEARYVSSGQRWEAELDDNPGYWVEFKAYPQPSENAAGPTKDDLERLVVRDLAILLRLKLPQSFRVPRCIGYYDEGGAFGLLFQKPPREASSHIIPLSHCLKHQCRPDLGARLALARAVVETVYQLHAVDWLHKALRAENILLFERTNNSIAYTESYISGFELARPASRPNMTQEADPGTKEDDFYRHPDNQLCNPHHRSYGYRKDFDLFSLGILLTEIALWAPIKTTVGDVSACEVKSLTLNESNGIMDRVRFATGGAFAEAVLVCLQGLDGQVESDSYSITFERLVVKKIRSIAVG